MGRYHQVVLRDSEGTWVARVDPEDFGYSLKFGAGSSFDANVLQMVVAAAEDHFGRALKPVWVDDGSGDGWDSTSFGSDPPNVPWDGPASLYEEPNLPYLVPSERGDPPRSLGREVQQINMVDGWVVGPVQ